MTVVTTTGTHRIQERLGVKEGDGGELLLPLLVGDIEMAMMVLLCVCDDEVVFNYAPNSKHRHTLDVSATVAIN